MTIYEFVAFPAYGTDLIFAEMAFRTGDFTTFRGLIFVIDQK